MQVVIKPTDGTPAFLLSVPPDATLAATVSLAAARLGVRDGDVALSCNGQVLRGARKLTEAGVGELSTLNASISTSVRERAPAAGADPSRPSDSPTAGGGGAAAAPRPAGAASAAPFASSLPAPAPALAPPPGAVSAEAVEDECSICLEPFAPLAPPCTLRCGHAFHGAITGGARVGLNLSIHWRACFARLMPPTPPHPPPFLHHNRRRVRARVVALQPVLPAVPAVDGAQPGEQRGCCARAQRAPCAPRCVSGAWRQRSGRRRLGGCSHGGCSHGGGGGGGAAGGAASAAVRRWKRGIGCVRGACGRGGAQGAPYVSC